MPHTSGSNTSNCHSHTRGYQTRDHHHIQLPPPNTWVPITSIIVRHQTHLTVITIYVGANQIQQLLPHTWATNHTQLPQPQLRAQSTSNWHHQTRGYQSTLPWPHTGHQIHPTATATHAGSNHIQLEIREYQSHPIAMTTHLGNQSHRTATTTHAGTNHIQLAQPTSWVPISSNCHATHFGITHPTATATHAGTNHIQLAPPNS